MRTNLIATLLFLFHGLMMLPLPYASAATDGFYLLSETSYGWDGTDANRTKAKSSSYSYTYGDEKSLTYILPWAFVFYGQSYNQITVDTNGNTWFGTSGVARSFNLVSNNRGPVISAWNNDLSSYYYGGVFIQHKTDAPLGERVVIEWKTETYPEEGYNRLNNFEVVLYPNSSFRTDYKTFGAVKRRDFGSGISKNDGTHYLNLTTTYAPAYSLVGRSFAFTHNSASISVAFTGTGSGSVTSNPDGLACNTNCSVNFFTGEQVTLHPSPAPYSVFTGWTNGACNGGGDCFLTLNNTASAIATFNKDTAHQVNIGGTYYSTIQAAYNAATDGAIIKLWATDYTETVTCATAKTVTLKGGYDNGYASVVGRINLHGALIVRGGKVIANGLTIH